MKITELIEELVLARQNGAKDVEFISSYYQVAQKPYLSHKRDDNNNLILLIEV